MHRLHRPVHWFARPRGLTVVLALAAMAGCERTSPPTKGNAPGVATVDELNRAREAARQRERARNGAKDEGRPPRPTLEPPTEVAAADRLDAAEWERLRDAIALLDAAKVDLDRMAITVKRWEGDAAEGERIRAAVDVVNAATRSLLVAISREEGKARARLGTRQNEVSSFELLHPARAAWLITAEAHAGLDIDGLNGYFGNAGEDVREVPRAFRVFGMEEWATGFEEAIACFPPGVPLDTYPLPLEEERKKAFYACEERLHAANADPFSVRIRYALEHREIFFRSDDE